MSGFYLPFASGVAGGDIARLISSREGPWDHQDEYEDEDDREGPWDQEDEHEDVDECKDQYEDSARKIKESWEWILNVKTRPGKDPAIQPHDMNEDNYEDASENYAWGLCGLEEV